MTNLQRFMCGFLAATMLSACRLDGGQSEPEKRPEPAALIAVATPEQPSMAELVNRIEALRESLSHVALDAAEAQAIANEAKGTAEMARDSAAAAAAVGEAHAAALANLQSAPVSTTEPTGRATTQARRAPAPATKFGK